MTKKVSILGCGWVGRALKESLDDLYDVVCLSKEIRMNENKHCYQCDVLVIAIPPRDNYLEVLQKSIQRIDPSTQVIFLSSISVYKDKKLVIEAEQLLDKLYDKTVVLRLGGLMGYDRIAGRYTAGKAWEFDTRTNYVHRDDVVGIIVSIIKLEIRNEIFDVVAPRQSTKKEIFTQNAKQFGFKENTFLDDEVRGKELTPEKLIQRLGYTFSKEDVKAFWNT